MWAHAEHTTLCHSTLTFCLFYIWFILIALGLIELMRELFMEPHPLYIIYTFIAFLYCFSQMEACCSFGLNLFEISFIDCEVRTSMVTSIPPPTDHNWHKLATPPYFLQGLKLATPPRPNGLQIPDCLRKDGPMSI